MKTDKATIELGLLSFYMKSFIDVNTSFIVDGNKSCEYMKGSIAYQEILTAQTLGQTAGGHVLINGYEKIFENKVRCIASFDSWKEAMFAELKYTKEKGTHMNLPFTATTITQEQNDAIDGLDAIDVGKPDKE